MLQFPILQKRWKMSLLVRVRQTEEAVANMNELIIKNNLPHLYSTFQFILCFLPIITLYSHHDSVR